jgi:gamma-glutamyltranspeptidase/glutathione hydrolase
MVVFREEVTNWRSHNEKGGNAFDAMIATELAAVAYPYAGNIGGGGFMCIAKQTESWYIRLPRKSAISSFKDMF